MYARAMQAKTQKLYKVIRFSSEIKKWAGASKDAACPAALALQ